MFIGGSIGFGVLIRGLREMMTFLKKKKEAGVPQDSEAAVAKK